MNASTFAVFAAVYLAIALFAISMPAVAGFYTFCFGASALKASRTPAPQVARRSPFGYARA